MPTANAHQATSCQKKALDALSGVHNVFITGAAGTGKSYVIQQYLRNKNTKQYPVIASTGAAAILIGGRTFHSFFGVGIAQGTVTEIVQNAMRNGQVKRRLQQAECVIIDEISMLSGFVLHVASEVAKAARGNVEPWGGLRIIAVGDFAQLPPVTRSGEPKDWAFMHSIWQQSAWKTINMCTVVRTEEKHLLTILDHIRSGTVTPEVRQFLQEKLYQSEQEFNGTRLFAHRRSADQYNQQRLNQLEFKEHVFATSFSGKSSYADRLKKNLPIPELLRIKCGALVMLRKNDTKFPYRYINGTLATVMEVEDDLLLLRLSNGKDIEITKQNFSLLDGGGAELAAATNFPITLAWATTIHKAQGATIDRLLVDLSQLWESGHAYVALSRVPSEHGLHIAQWNERSIKIDPVVQDFYASL